MLKLKNLYFLKVLNLKLLFQITTKLKRISSKFKILKVKLLVKVVQVVGGGLGQVAPEGLEVQGLGDLELEDLEKQFQRYNSISTELAKQKQ